MKGNGGRLNVFSLLRLTRFDPFLGGVQGRGDVKERGR